MRLWQTGKFAMSGIGYLSRWVTQMAKIEMEQEAGDGGTHKNNDNACKKKNGQDALSTNENNTRLVRDHPSGGITTAQQLLNSRTIVCSTNGGNATKVLIIYNARCTRADQATASASKSCGRFPSAHF